MKWDAQVYDTVKAPQVDAGRELISIANVKDSDSILDLGCGTGKLTMELSRLLLNGNINGIDPSKEMTDKARERFDSAQNVSIFRIPAQSMKYKNEFDLVYSNSALHWVKEQQMVLKLVYDSLKEGGRIAFQMPAKDFCREFIEYTGKAMETPGFEEYFRGWEPQWYMPSKKEYRSFLEDAGFENIKVYYRDYELLFENIDEVLGWWSSAGLIPFIERLPLRRRDAFKYSFAMNFENNRTDKGIEFNFRRLFAFAEKYGR